MPQSITGRPASAPVRSSATEPRADATTLRDPRAWKRLMLDAASRGPTLVDESTGAVHVLRYHDVERLLHEPRLHGLPFRARHAAAGCSPTSSAARRAACSDLEGCAARAHGASAQRPGRAR